MFLCTLFLCGVICKSVCLCKHLPREAQDREHPASVQSIILPSFVNETDVLTLFFPFLLLQRDDRSPASGPPSFSSPIFGLKPRSGELDLG